MTPNLHLLQQRCAEIRTTLRQLDAAGQLPSEQFLAEELLIDASLYRLIRAIESAQAICTHLAARIPTRTPNSGPDCFLALAESKVIGTELAERLQQMSRFRNLLVHRYWELDLSRVHDILKNDIQDLELYVQSIEDFLR